MNYLNFGQFHLGGNKLNFYHAVRLDDLQEVLLHQVILQVVDVEFHNRVFEEDVMVEMKEITINNR